MVLNPLPSWQDSLYLAPLSLTPSGTLFFTWPALLFFKVVATWSTTAFLYCEEKLREETDATSSGEIWSEASKDNFQFRHLRWGWTAPPSFSIVSRSLSVQMAARALASASLTSHPREFRENKTLRETWGLLFPLYTPSKHLLHVKCLGLEHRRWMAHRRCPISPGVFPAGRA